MKKIILIWGWVLSLGLAVYATPTSVHATDVDKTLNAPCHYIGHDKTGMYCHYWVQMAQYNNLVKYDNHDNIVAQKTILPIGGLSKVMFRAQFFFSDGRLYVVANKMLHKEKRFLMLAQEVDINTLEYKGDLKIISNVYHDLRNWAMQAQLIKPENCPYFILVEGNNKSSLIKLFNSNFDSVESKLLPNVAIMDVAKQALQGRNYTDAENVWQTTNPYLADKPYYLVLCPSVNTGLTADSAGDIFLNTFFKVPDKDKGAARVGNYLYILPKNNNKPIEIKLDNDGHLSSTSIAVHNGELICAGFYSNFDRKVPLGTTYSRFDIVTGRIIVTRQQALSSAVLQSLPLKDEYPIILGNPKTEFYYLNPVLLGTGSDVFLSFEHQEHVNQGSGPPTQSGQNRATVGYDDYREIVAMHISSTGDIIWQKQIPRRVNGAGTVNEHSFVPVARNGNFYALYVDEATNVDVSNIEDMKRVKQWEPNNPLGASQRALVQAVISPEGRLERSNLEAFDFGYTASPFQSWPDDQGNPIIPVCDLTIYANGKWTKLDHVTIDAPHGPTH